MPRKSLKKSVNSHIALCYVRLSWTKDESDANSPERQRSNIELVCQQNGWIPEWYEDVDGHKTGTKEKNRPGWLALKARLSDADVIALVANDLSRLHRKGWRVGDLLDFVDEHDVRLVLAAPGKQLDFSTPQGRIIAQLSAIFDEWYAIDISQRSKDMISHRKRQGKTVGRPPFGTKRNKSGYLVESDEGAWYMPDGTFLAGSENQVPDEGAIWRRYFKAAEFVLKTYAEGKLGIEAIAYKMQIEGWAFRDRYGNPSPFEGDDVRRIVANWPEYGGFVSKERARERHPLDYPIEDIVLNPERAVFELPLLYRVGRVRLERTTKKTADESINIDTYPYPLNGITYCYHCEQLAAHHTNPKLRSRLGGKGRKKQPRYRHRPGVKCGTTNRSVRREIYERDFARLLKLLTVDTSQVDLMAELAVQSVKAQAADETDFEQEKRAAIARCRRRIEAARHLYEDGDLTREEYLRRKDQNEREIAHWETRTTETEKIALELALCLEAIDKINQLWDISDDEDKQGMARNLFSYIVYDLDIQRIVDFRLKPWADRFVTLRAALYEDPEGKENPSSEAQGEGTHVTLTGLEPVSSP
ncbi:MAG: recombinase family protein [Anaerolinea sp.]|nr:recombinase family protein [Anaerolinea sp.]